MNKCQECDKPISDNKMFCSRHCLKLYVGFFICKNQRVCIQCGKEIKSLDEHIESFGDAMFCSEKCYFDNYDKYIDKE
jgi:predicted nucleic acid-binding Zn ribbon protein